MTVLNRLQLHPFYQVAGDASTGGAPAAGSTPAASGAPAATSTPNPSAPAGAPSSAAAAPPAKEYKYQEDRTDWIPPHRMTEASRQRAQLMRDLEIERQRVAALSGVKLPDPKAGERDELRQALAEIDPRLGKLLSLDEKKLDSLLGFADRIPDVEATIDRYWNNSTSGVLQTTAEKFAKAGVRFNLADDDDREFVQATLVRFIKADRTGRREDRFEGGDHTVLDEFVTYFTGKFGSPAAAATAETTVAARTSERQRQTLPAAGPRGSGLPSGAAAAAAGGDPNKNPNSPGDRRSLHSRARQSYLERVGARS